MSGTRTDQSGASFARQARPSDLPGRGAVFHFVKTIANLIRLGNGCPQMERAWGLGRPPMSLVDTKNRPFRHGIREQPFLARRGMPIQWLRILPLLLLAQCITSAQTNTNGWRLTGTSVYQLFGGDGDVVRRDEIEFVAEIAGCTWRVELSTPSAQGGVTEVSCDNTNIYVLARGAGGRLGRQNGASQFHNSANVYSGTVMPFRAHMGMIWWTYCSACVLPPTEGDVPEFLYLISGTSGPGTLFYRPTKRSELLFLAPPADASLPPLAEKTVLMQAHSNNYFFAKTALIRRYDQINRTPDGMPRVLEDYRLHCTQITAIPLTNISVVPQFTMDTLVNDLSSTVGRITYVASNYLGQDEALRRASEARAILQRPTSARGVTRPEFLFWLLSTFVLTATLSAVVVAKVTKRKTPNAKQATN